jgi:hypothetical protein
MNVLQGESSMRLGLADFRRYIVSAFGTVVFYLLSPDRYLNLTSFM